MSELAKGFTCTCGAEHAYPPYVFAHWRDKLTHTCEHCGALHEIVMGVATPKGGRKK
jgi:hypothetical protein